MDKKKLEKFRKILTKQLDDIDHSKDQIKKEIIVQDQFADVTDRASHEIDQQFDLRIRERERILANKIKKTLEKIDAGEFGVCEQCGDDISEERLLARPVTDLCINCKTQQEHEEKQYSEE